MLRPQGRSQRAVDVAKRPARKPSATITATADVEAPEEENRRRVTIREVAAAAGVSPMTVSNVINGNTRFVGEQTRRRVLLQIERLNYRVLSSGRNLRLGRRQAIGVIVVDELRDFMSNPYISRVVSGLCGVLNASGYTMIVQGVHPRDFASTFAMRRTEADAFCVRLHGKVEARAGMLEALARLHEPVALIQETLAAGGDDRCIVRQDDQGGGRLIADHLAARDIQRLCIIVPRFRGPMTEARVQGVVDGLRAAKRTISIEYVECDLNAFASAYGAIESRLENPPVPDAIFGVNDELALAALRALQDREFTVPDDVLVAGFNGFNPPSYTRPSLTTVVSRAVDVGISAGELLLARLADGRFSRPEAILPLSFRKGEST